MKDTRIETHEVKRGQCPACGHLLECATNAMVGGHAPKEGDLTVCAYCGVTLVFVANDDDAELSYRTATDADLIDLDDATKAGLMRAQQASADFRRNQGDA